MQDANATLHIEPSSENGISLLLVMLSLLVLSVLAGAMVLTSRSETLSSYNYKLETQADYLAKAGIQQSINWLRSNRYQMVTESQAPTYYQVTSDGSLFNLYTANTTPVICINGCPTTNSAVQLIGIPGTGSSNYPSINDASGVTVASAFTNDLVGVRVTADNNDSGTFSVNLQLVNYQTVNMGTMPSITQQPVETWLVTSQGTWTGNSGSNSTIAKAVEQAVVQPVYTPTWGNALYGYCSVAMQGSSGVCTDSFNSAMGPYGGGVNHTASGACDSTSTNVIAAGAGVGANGGVTLGNNVTVSGNVTIGTTPTSGCSANGFSGSSSSVLGEVVEGPHINPPPAPTFPSTLSSAPAYSGSTTLPAGFPWPNNLSFPYGPSLVGYNQPCPTGGNCAGTLTNPYQISSVSIASNSVLDLIGGPNIANPVYYDIGSLSESGNAQINVSGYVVLNVQTGLSITGNGITDGVSSDIPPEAVQINYAGTAAASIGGNGAVSAIISAPNSTVNLGGGAGKG